MPGFFYRGHLPGLADYSQHRWQYELRFFFPYGVASVVLTFICLFAAPKLADCFSRSRNVAVDAVTSLVLILVVAACSDVMNVIWIENGVFYGSSLDSYLRLIKVGLPLAVTSALLAVAPQETLPRPGFVINFHVAH